MDSSGITFGSHTHNHVILQYANDNLARDELENSRQILTEQLGTVPEYFCYPNARYRTDNADILQSTGYRFAFRMHNLPLDADYNRYFIPRYLLNEYLCSNRNNLKCKLLGIPGFR
jgi:peptidoglycan/xylan/chitin deacetylase (PgdA/CDA1 family)